MQSEKSTKNPLHFANKKFVNFFTHRVMLTFIVLAIYAVPFFAYAEDYAPLKEENGQQIYVMHMGGMEYHVPAAYLRFVVGKPKENAPNLLINTMLPEMGPIPPDGPEVKIPGWGHHVTFLVADAVSTTSFEFRLDATKKFFGPLHPSGDQFSLHEFITSKGDSGRVIERDMPVYSGSKTIENPTAEQRNGLLEEFYVDGVSDKPTVYITCNGNSAVPSPGCSEEFANDGLLYQLDFGKEHLREWEAIRASAIKLIQSFAVGTTKKPIITGKE